MATVQETAATKGSLYVSYIANLFRSHGFKVETGYQTEYYGADLLVYGLGEEDEPLYAVQCKSCSQDVGCSAIQEIYGATAYYKARTPILVSNQPVTEPAGEMAEKLGVVVLRVSRPDTRSKARKLLGPFKRNVYLAVIPLLAILCFLVWHNLRQGPSRVHEATGTLRQSRTETPDGRAATPKAVARNSQGTVVIPNTWVEVPAQKQEGHGTTYAWYDPQDRNQKLTIVVTTGAGDASQWVPRGASLYRIRPWKIAYSIKSAGNPYPDNGLVEVGGQLGENKTGNEYSYALKADLFLPAAKHSLATEILDSISGWIQLPQR